MKILNKKKIEEYLNETSPKYSDYYDELEW